MKIKIIIGLILVSTTFAIAVIITPFQGWEWTEEKSNDIIIVRCLETPQRAYGEGMIQSKINITAVLKGTNSLGPAALLTQIPLTQGEDYLLLANYSDGNYDAFETYRVVPLGIHVEVIPYTSFDTNAIAGKPLDQQLQILYKHSINVLDNQIKEDQEKINLLEEALPPSK